VGGREEEREEGRKGGWMSSEGFGHCNIMRKYQNSRHIIKNILYYGARFTFSVVWRV